MTKIWLKIIDELFLHIKLLIDRTYKFCEIYSMFKKILITISTMAGFISTYLFYTFYLSIKFNSEGLAFDPLMGVAYNENAFVWGILAAIFFIPIIIRIFIKRKNNS